MSNIANLVIITRQVEWSETELIKALAFETPKQADEFFEGFAENGLKEPYSARRDGDCVFYILENGVVIGQIVRINTWIGTRANYDFAREVLELDGEEEFDDGPRAKGF